MLRTEAVETSKLRVVPRLARSWLHLRGKTSSDSSSLLNPSQYAYRSPTYHLFYTDLKHLSLVLPSWTRLVNRGTIC